MQGLDFFQNGSPFVRFIAEDALGPMRADAGPIRRNRDDGQMIRLPEFASSFAGGPSHARQLMEAAEETLEAEPRDGLSRIGDRHAFFRFDGLVHALAPVSLRHRAASKLIDDDNLLRFD